MSIPAATMEPEASDFFRTLLLYFSSLTLSSFTPSLELLRTLLTAVIEIGILYTIIYMVFSYLRGTRGAPVLAGLVMLLILLNLLSQWLGLEVISWILENSWIILSVTIAVIFQPELRRSLAHIGTMIGSMFGQQNKTDHLINEIVVAAGNLSARRHGALMVVENEIKMGALVANAVRIDAKISHQLLESIFFKNTPLHDGGVIINRDGQVVAAHCIFPMPSNEEVRKELGTRHRAAIGITEQTDAIAVVVSEETGRISFAYNGQFKVNLRCEDLRFLLTTAFTNKKSIESLFTADVMDKNIYHG